MLCLSPSLEEPYEAEPPLSPLSSKNIYAISAYSNSITKSSFSASIGTI